MHLIFQVLLLLNLNIIANYFLISNIRGGDIETERKKADEVESKIAEKVAAQNINFRFHEKLGDGFSRKCISILWGGPIDCTLFRFSAFSKIL